MENYWLSVAQRIQALAQAGLTYSPNDYDLDRYHLAMDAIDRLPHTGENGLYLKQQLKAKLIEHRQYINTHGEDLPEIRNWKWDATQPAVHL